MDYERIYKKSKLDEPLQPIEDGLPVRESTDVENLQEEYLREIEITKQSLMQNGHRVGFDKSRLTFLILH